MALATSWIARVALLTVAIVAFASTVAGTPPAAGFLTRSEDAKAQQRSALDFGGGGGGMGFGQRLGLAADRVAQRVSETLTSPFRVPGGVTENEETAPTNGEKEPAADGEKKPPEADDKPRIVPGFDLVPSDPSPPVVPQSTAAAAAAEAATVVQDPTKPTPLEDEVTTESGNKLETTTETRNLVDAPLKNYCGENQHRNRNHECVDGQSDPDDTSKNQ